MTVELIGDIEKRDREEWSRPQNLKDLVQWIPYDEMRLSVLPLAYEAHAYRLLGRDDRALELEKWTKDHDL